MAYDPARRRIVLFGGEYRSKSYSDTWEWDGKTWIRMNPPVSPPARYGHAMVYDSSRRKVVLFGGGKYSSSGAYFSDTWEWDGKRWERIPAGPGPQYRKYHGMAYDPSRKRIVLMGGEYNYGYLSDTWEFRIRPRASFATRGKGCPGSNRKIPVLSARSLPALGKDFVLELRDGPILVGTGLVFGFSPLNLDLSSLGAPGCVVLNTPDLILPNVTNLTGTWSFPHVIPIPVDVQLIGGKIYLQVLVFDKRANTLGVAASNGGLAAVDW